MPEVSATDAARNFAELLDAVEYRGEQFTIVRRGKAVAHLDPIGRGTGAEVKTMLRRHRRDTRFGDDIAALRELLEIEIRS